MNMKKNIILRKMVPYLMLAPALIIILIFKIYPIVSVILESFFRNGSPSLRTYEILFGDRNFWGALGTTVKNEPGHDPAADRDLPVPGSFSKLYHQGHRHFQEYLLSAGYHGYLSSFHQLESDGKLQQWCI